MKNTINQLTIEEAKSIFMKDGQPISLDEAFETGFQNEFDNNGNPEPHCIYGHEWRSFSLDELMLMDIMNPSQMQEAQHLYEEWENIEYLNWNRIIKRGISMKDRNKNIEHYISNLDDVKVGEVIQAKGNVFKYRRLDIDNWEEIVLKEKFTTQQLIDEALDFYILKPEKKNRGMSMGMWVQQNERYDFT